MKNIIELSLVAVLVAVLSLNAKMSGINSLLGKAILIASVICMSHKFGTNAGLLSAAIAIVLLNKNLREGMDHDGKSDEKDDKKDNEEEDKKDHKKKGDEKEDDGEHDLAHVEASNSDKKGDDNGNNDDDGNNDDEDNEHGKKKGGDEKSSENEDGKENFIGSMTKRLVGGIIHSADEFLNLPQTLVAYRTNDDIMTGMRRMEQAKQAPGGCALYTKHTDTMKIVNGTN